MYGQFSGSHEVELFELFQLFWGSVQCFKLTSKEGTQSMHDISAQQKTNISIYDRAL